MQSVPGLADSGVKFFDQGVVFQINALVNIREGVKKLSTELKEVLKEKEKLEKTVFKLKAENETLERLLKQSFGESRQPVAMHNCLIVTDKFARTLSDVSVQKANQRLYFEEDIVQDLIDKVQEAHQSSSVSSNTCNIVDRHKTVAGSDERYKENASESMVIQQESSPASINISRVTSCGKTPTVHERETYERPRIQTREYRDTSQDSDHSNSAPHQQQTIMTTDTSNDHTADYSMPNETGIEGIDLSRSDIIEIKVEEGGDDGDMDIGTVHSSEVADLQENSSQSQFIAPSATYISTLPEPILTESALPTDASCPEVPVFVLSSSETAHVSETDQLAQPKAPMLSPDDTPSFARPARSSWRSMDYRKTVPISLRRDALSMTPSASSSTVTARGYSGQKTAIPKYRGSLYHGSRVSMAGGKNTGSSTSTASVSGATKAFGSPQVKGKDESLGLKSKDRPYDCETCGKDFRRLEDLRTHLRTHTGEKPFKCSVCGFRFSVRCNLLRHERIHMAEKPYGCRLCGKGFTRLGTLKQHALKHHPASSVCIMRRQRPSIAMLDSMPQKDPDVIADDAGLNPNTSDPNFSSGFNL